MCIDEIIYMTATRTQSEETGFLVVPPPSSKFGVSEFRFEFIVRKREAYIERNESMESSAVLAHSPYGIMPQEGQSVMLTLAETGIAGSPQSSTPVILHIANGELDTAVSLAPPAAAGHDPSLI